MGMREAILVNYSRYCITLTSAVMLVSEKKPQKKIEKLSFSFYETTWPAYVVVILDELTKKEKPGAGKLSVMNANDGYIGDILKNSVRLRESCKN